jgi:16S rRNA C1402 (ribose-2'-O) methylase RsmI
MNPLSRLKCACVFTESAQRLEKLLDEVESTKKEKDIREALRELKALYEEHVTQHNTQFSHSLIEFHPFVGPLLKTTAFSAGELKRARNPTKPSGKKEKRKKKRADLGK